MKKIILLALVLAGIIIPVETAGAHLLTYRAAGSSARAVCSQINGLPAAVNPYHCSVGAARRRSRHAIDVRLSLYDQADGERCTASVRVGFGGSRTHRRGVRRLGHNCAGNPFRTEAPPLVGVPPAGPALAVSEAEAYVRQRGDYILRTSDVYAYEVGPCTRRSSYQVDCLMTTWVPNGQYPGYVHPCWDDYYVWRRSDGVVDAQFIHRACNQSDLRPVG